MSYSRFALMIVTSTIVMFGLMYLNTYALEHVFFSQTRAWMALLMGAVMALIMLGFMWAMYQGRGTKIAILLGSVVVFALSLWLVRSQATVDGVSYMRAMIPHHSIAIMTSERAGIVDARNRKLADGIIEAQEREIAEMRYIIADISKNGVQQRTYQDPAPHTGTVADALSNTLLAQLDPAQMTADEIAQIAPGATCAFRQTEVAPPILATAEIAAGMKLNGVLLALTKSDDTTWSAPGVTMTVMPDADAGPRANADLVFALQDGPTIGYRGFWSCEG